jgi:AbrB family looped-hinge helix DNA binding protein
MQSSPVKTTINENGRLVIPFRMRRAMGLEPGDAVTLTLEDGVLRIEAQRAQVQRIQDALKGYAKASRGSQELTADRREETRIEMEEWLG